MRKVLLILPLVAACGQTASPGIRVETQKIYIEKPVPCVEVKDIPQAPAPMPARPENTSQALDLAIDKLVELLGPKLDGKAGYVGKVGTILNGACKQW